MKKLLFMFATAALVLSACSSEDDIVQGGGSLSQLGASGALGFDVYTASATKAGDPVGVMNTEKLKTLGKGFGVFAMYQNGVDYSQSCTPNFMFNEHVSWNGGWSYSPLKYWPNETTKDSQDPAATSDQTDKLSFFAYAPYVGTLTTEGTMVTELPSTTTEAMVASPAETSGIISFTRKNHAGDPLVEWAVNANPDQNVDLLWGVAPAGMSYQDVTGGTTTANAGKPLLNMVKPDKDQRMKFLFQHALSRIGLSVVSAIDQIAAGDDGGKYTTAQTRVLIEEVRIWGNFGKKGVLNLNNPTANVANWVEASVDRTASTVGDPTFIINTANGYLAPDLRYVDADVTAVGGDDSKFADLNEGVLPSEKSLMVGGPDPSKAVTDPAFEVGKVYYKQDGVDYVVATTSATTAVNAYELTGNYDEVDSYFTQVFKTDAGSKAKVSGNTKQLYTLTVTEKDASVDNIATNAVYYTRTGDDGAYVYTCTKNTTGAPITAGTYYLISDKADLAVDDYAAGDYWTALQPRYFMVIPSKLPVAVDSKTTINVKITYRVVTKDTKLSGNVSNVSNAITKETSIQLQNGKSYNLKLILGLTSVKLDATVADWLVADDTEIWLPRNNE